MTTVLKWLVTCSAGLAVLAVGDLVRLLVRDEAAIRQCNADKLGLREYTARVNGGSDE